MRANISRGYLLRIGAIALICAGGALWFYYDGAIGYPAQRERALKYQELEEKDQLDEWPKVAKENGWPAQDPGEPKTEAEIAAQLVIGSLIAPFGVLYIVIFFRHVGRWIEADDDGLHTSAGQHVPYANIVRLEKKKWDAKGIARAYYEQDGRRGKVLLDDWKFDTEPTRAILRQVESQIPEDRITGGPPEPPPKPSEDEAADAEESERGEG